MKPLFQFRGFGLVEIWRRYQPSSPQNPWKPRRTSKVRQLSVPKRPKAGNHWKQKLPRWLESCAPGVPPPGTVSVGRDKWGGVAMKLAFSGGLSVRRKGKCEMLGGKSSVWSHVLHPNRPRPRYFLFLKVYSDTNFSQNCSYHHGRIFLHVTWKGKKCHTPCFGGENSELR